MLYYVSPHDLIPIYKGLDEGSGASVDFHYDYNLLFWAEKGDGQMFRANLTRDGETLTYDISLQYYTTPCKKQPESSTSKF